VILHFPPACQLILISPGAVLLSQNANPMSILYYVFKACLPCSIQLKFQVQRIDTMVSLGIQNPDYIEMILTTVKDFLAVHINQTQIIHMVHKIPLPF
jgi:hypothetical protein